MDCFSVWYPSGFKCSGAVKPSLYTRENRWLWHCTFQQNLQAADSAFKIRCDDARTCHICNYTHLEGLEYVHRGLSLKWEHSLWTSWCPSSYQFLQQFSNCCRLSCWTLPSVDCPNVPLFSKVSKGILNVCLQFSTCSLTVLLAADSTREL